MTRRRKQSDAPTVRCAIYTRKSTEEGLEQEFSSLDAQRDSGEAYIASQTYVSRSSSTRRRPWGGSS